MPDIDSTHTGVERDKLFSPATFALICAGIAINYLGSRLALHFEIPLFLDCIGTVLAAALGGYLPGIVVGFLTNVIGSASDSITLYYGLLNVLIAIVAAFLSSKRVFTHLGPTLLSVLLLSLVGGGLGSLLTWLLYGFDFGTGISAPFAISIDQATQLGKFWSQFVADMGIDLADKAISLLIMFIVLRILPPSFLRHFPYGYIYYLSDWAQLRNKRRERGLELREQLLDGQADAKQARAQMLAAAQQDAEDLRKAFYSRYSLRHKVALIIIASAVVLSAASITISYLIYKDNLTARYQQNGMQVLDLADKVITEDYVDAWLAADLAAPGNEQLKAAYARETKQLSEILESMTDVEYLYVYQIREDGCHVVFDVDTGALAGEPLGTVLDFDEGFADKLPALLSGQEIEPVTATGQYGWLLSVYRPLYDSQGDCVAYAAVDYDMNRVVSDRYVFIIRIAALLFGVSIMIVAFVLWFADRRVVRPINLLASATNNFAYDNEEDRQESMQVLHELSVHTGDEIENLHDAIEKMTEDVSNYITEVDEKTHEIALMQDNTIISFASMIESRDSNTGGHIHRTAEYVRIIGTDMFKHGDYPDVLTAEYLESMIQSAPLHDVGKIKVPDAILNKPGKLTPEEFAVMQTHTTEGAHILEGIFVGIKGKNRLSEATDMAHYHHERWDGGGYPCGLAGDTIPLCARVMAIADVFDALLSRRSYKEPFSFDEAASIIVVGSDGFFDPVVVEAFLRTKGQLAAEVEAPAHLNAR